MKKTNIGNLFIIFCVIATIAVWALFPPEPGLANHYARAYAGEVLGSILIVLMSFSLFLSARPKWVEPYFGGLDKMYVTHRRVSTSAFLLLFLHLLIVPITFVNLRLGNYLAVIAFLGIVTIVLVTLAPRIVFLNKLTGNTYEGWKNLHRYIGIFFVVGFVHSLTVNALTAHVAINWVQIFFIFGTASYLYTEIFGRFFKKHVPYVVTSVKHPNSSTTEVTLTPKKDSIQHDHAGQFLFVRFLGVKGLDESHPFTISSAPSENVLRVTIKACGDFTRHLFENLKEGTEAIVEGAYGMFNYKTGSKNQIWVAGGIGVTPFLSFIRDLATDLSHDVHFYYTVRHQDEAIFVDEIESIVKKHPRLKPHIRFSAKHGSLTVDEIVKDAGGNLDGHDVYMCGPVPMVQAFEKKFLELGVSREHIHYEEFNFR
ncbi:MAG: ferric reductase-like transmembrane domain-containing protein [Anaerolineales bacterium]